MDVRNPVCPLDEQTLGPGDEPKLIPVARQTLECHERHLLRSSQFQLRDDVKYLRFHRYIRLARGPAISGELRARIRSGILPSSQNKSPCNAYQNVLWILARFRKQLARKDRKGNGRYAARKRRSSSSQIANSF